MAKEIIILILSLSYAIFVSLSSSAISLFAASLLPICFLLTKKFSPARLLKVNIINLIVIFTLTLTWPDSFAGFETGLKIALRVNMILIFFGTVLYPLGISGIRKALFALGVPEKMRVLMILTLRGIEILEESYRTALTSARLRAPELRGLMKLKVFASVLGAVLITSLERSEEISRAVKSRGGFGGFSQ